MLVPHLNDLFEASKPAFALLSGHLAIRIVCAMIISAGREAERVE